MNAVRFEFAEEILQRRRVVPRMFQEVLASLDEGLLDGASTLQRLDTGVRSVEAFVKRACELVETETENRSGVYWSAHASLIAACWYELVSRNRALSGVSSAWSSSQAKA